MGMVGTAVSVIGDIIGGIAQEHANQQTQNFENTTLGNQSQALSGVGPLATQLANGIPYQQLLDVQKGGIQSLKSQVGGIPNEGTLIKQLYGGATTNALDASIQNKQAGLSSAANALLGVGSQYGQDARMAMTVPQPNPWAPLFSTVGGAFGGKSTQPGGSPGGSPLQLGAGSTETQIGGAGPSAFPGGIDPNLVLPGGLPDPSVLPAAVG